MARLFPALNVNGKIHKGEKDDSHNTLGERLGIPHPEHVRGFTKDGTQFHDRHEALRILRKEDPETFRKLPKEAHKIGLHSEHLAKAYGIKQKPQAVAITREAMAEQEVTLPERKLSEMTAMVFDRGGLYLYNAEKLAEKFGKVYYYLADADAYPTSQKASIGTGIPKIKRVHSFWKTLKRDRPDIIYFFDCYDGDLQVHLREDDHYPVFGSGQGEDIEIDKIFFLEALEKLGLPCPKTYVAEGMDDLCDYLTKHDGETLFLKNLHRGDFESRKFTSMAQSRPFLSDLKKRLGSASDTIEVLVQHKVDSVVEVGYDGYCVDGEFTKNCIVGYEIKDRGFVAKVFAEIPEIVGSINDAFSETLKKLGGRGNYSTEIRVTKAGMQFYIDPTQRVPSPPGELMCEIYENWAEATVAIANGELPELKPKALYGAEVILCSAWHDEHEIHVKFPAKFKQHVKLKNHKIVDGEYYCVPNGNGTFFGAVVAWADTLDKAIAKVVEVAESIEADEYSFDPSVFDEAKKAAEAGAAFGVRY